MTFYNYRLVSAEAILNEWRSIGIEDGELVLRDLGLFNEDEADLENIDVEDLSRLLQVIFSSCYLLPAFLMPDLQASHFRIDWLSWLGLGNQVDSTTDHL